MFLTKTANALSFVRPKATRRKEPTMKSSVCLIAALIVSLAADTYAQTARGPEETLDGFQDTHWGETSAVVKSKMAKIDGVTLDASTTAQFTDGTLCFTGGRFANETVERYEARFTKDALYSVSIIISKWGSENLVQVYDKIKTYLTARYGKPANDFSKFSDPFKKGDGREDVAFAAGKGVMTCLWTFAVPGEMSNSIYMDVNQRLQISVRFENGKLLREALPRKK